MTRVLCPGIGSRGVRSRSSVLYPECPVCGKEFSAQGRKAYARLVRYGNPWETIPRHYKEKP